MSQLFDVVHKPYHGHKGGKAAVGLTRDAADKYAEEMSTCYPGHEYTVVESETRLSKKSKVK